MMQVFDAVSPSSQHSPRRRLPPLPCAGGASLLLAYESAKMWTRFGTILFRYRHSIHMSVNIALASNKDNIIVYTK